METQIIYKLPVSATDCLTAQIVFEGTDVLLRVDYEEEDGDVRSAGVRFNHVQLFRFENEMHSNVYPPGAYDAVVEVGQSDWIAEVERFEKQNNRDSPWGKKHFCIFVSSKGQLNVIAESVSIEKDEQRLARAGSR
jgi:hypothetical protein